MSEGDATVTVSEPQPVEVLPRRPLTLIPLGDAGASCEGDSCSI